MPEYLAPGVYVEETSFRAKSIAGVGTTTAGFIGPARFGPTQYGGALGAPEILTSIGEFERTYGDGNELLLGTDFPKQQAITNFLWQAVRAFFTEGGNKLYIARVFMPRHVPQPGTSGVFTQGTLPDGRLAIFDEGIATWDPQSSPPRDPLANPPVPSAVQASWPGTAGNMRVRFTLRILANVFSRVPNRQPTFGGLGQYDVVWIGTLKPDDPQASPPAPAQYEGGYYLATQQFDATTGQIAYQVTDSLGSVYTLMQHPESPPQQPVWYFTDKNGARAPFDQAVPQTDPQLEIHVVRLMVTVYPVDPASATQVWDVAPDPRHQSGGVPDALATTFDQKSLYASPNLPIQMNMGYGAQDGLKVLAALKHISPDLVPDSWLLSAGLSFSQDIVLAGGNDGQQPTATEYTGTADPDSAFKTGLKAFEDLDDVSTVAAPGCTFNFTNNKDEATAILEQLIAHAEYMKYRIAVLDCGDKLTVGKVREQRGRLDSKWAALYYPWVTVLDPITRRLINLPPSGFVAGIYARNDINRAVYKAPANEVVTLAQGFETVLNKAQQDVLNPLGVNCFRFFEGRGHLLWGARTTTDDPEWKYVNLRRYFAYLEHSIDLGTQWAVFEPNGPQLWNNIRLTIGDFLFNEWKSGALLGDTPETSYFVRCDRSTMTQNDLDNGRLVCLIGVAAVRPAEYVIFRIGQWTGDRK